MTRTLDEFERIIARRIRVLRNLFGALNAKVDNTISIYQGYTEWKN